MCCKIVTDSAHLIVGTGGLGRLHYNFRLPLENVISMPPILSNRKPVPALTGLRGVAVMLVVMFHSGFPPLEGGSIGVDIFFVLSGFLITSLILAERAETGTFNFRMFYLKRALRLFPALALLLLVFMSLCFFFAFPAPFRDAWQESLIVALYMANWTRAFNFYGPEYLGHTWSLSIEEQFYIIWPMLLLAICVLRSSRSRILLIAALLLLSLGTRCWMTNHGASVDRLYNGLDTRADALLAGAFAATVLAGFELGTDNCVRLQRWLRVLSPLSFLSLLIVATFVSELTKFGFYAVYTIVQALTLVVILDCVIGKGGSVKAFLESRVVVWLGTISYGIYLWHYPVALTVYQHKIQPPVRFAITLGFALLAATASYYLIEKRFLGMKSRLTLKVSDADLRKKRGLVVTD